MAAASSYLEAALLNETLRNTNYTPPGSVWLALYTTNPTAADVGTEVSGGSYARVTAAFNAPSGGTCTNSADLNITGMPATTVSYIGIRDASTAGNLLYYAALSAAKTTNAGDTFTIRAGDLSIAVS